MAAFGGGEAIVNLALIAFQIWPQLHYLYLAVTPFPLSCPHTKHKSPGLLLSEEKLTLSGRISLVFSTGRTIVP